jgi:FixJ family two-component response regulator
MRVPNGPLVAIVDDDASIRRATQNLLEAAGFATVAFSGAEGFLAFALRADVKCLVADMRMPGMSGLALHQALAASGRTIPAILVTAYPDEATRARAKSAGILCFLAKPFAEDELLACVRAALVPSGATENGEDPPSSPGQGTS